MRKGRSSPYERVFLGLACTVTVVWSIAVLIQVAFPRHRVPPTVNYVMPIVMFAFFGGHAYSATRNGKREENGTDDEK